MERDLVALAGLDVAVQAVVGGVDLPLLEPLRPRRVPLEHGLPGLEPVELLGPALPPGLEVGLRLVVDRGVGEVRLLYEVLRRRERLLVAQEYLKVLAFLGRLGHLSLPVDRSSFGFFPGSDLRYAYRVRHQTAPAASTSRL